MMRTSGLAIGLLAVVLLSGCAAGAADVAGSAEAPEAVAHTSTPSPSAGPARAVETPGPATDSAGSAPADTVEVEPIPQEPAVGQPVEQPVEQPAEEPADDWMPTAEEQRDWLAHQQIVRDCMAEAGQEYLYWEWWSNPSGAFAAMPVDLTEEERAAWELALDGAAGTGADYRWQDAGCWGLAAELTGSTN
ncbi:hypothetical protein [Agromyces allii]|uniref:Uncharacterized protein n=1 Tax=Agromyces allii TaxID=393607 RepID=A0ABP5C9M9_9MICO|nr:hypothetical protein [Agromyces allii]